MHIKQNRSFLHSVLSRQEKVVVILGSAWWKTET